MKIALITDIHGSSLAFDHVLADIQAHGGVDGFWFLGDYAAIGPDPVGVLERVAVLPNTKFIYGNTDRFLVEGDAPWPKLVDLDQDRSLVELHLTVARSFAWTTGAVAGHGWLPWLKNLPLEVRTTLPDGTRVLMVHAAPGTDDGMGIHQGTKDEELADLVGGAEADLVLVGHTHVPFDRSVNGIRVVNPGSVSNPFPPDLRASYALLEAGETGYSIELRRVDYDREAVIRSMHELQHPSAGYVEKFLRGEVRKDWSE